jgi:hypothetical protein
MPNSVSAAIEYFFQEGKENLEHCLRIAFETAAHRDVKKIVIFTGIGEGPKMAIERFRVQPRFADIKVIAVTFPNGLFEHSVISDDDRKYLHSNDVPIVRAHLPFDPIKAHHENHGILGQDLTLIGNALSIFCGSMSLCVQATVMACDAGEVDLGEHIIALTSDTAILVRSAPTSRLLTDLIVREILCKPMSLTIGKKEKSLASTEPLTLEASIEQTDLFGPTSEG